MASIVPYDPNTNYAQDIITNQDPAVWAGVPNVVILSSDAEITAAYTLFRDVARKYITRDLATVRAMTVQEKAIVDAAEAAALDLLIRNGAKGSIVGFQSQPLVLRAVADTIKDEINLLRQWIVAFKAQTALATSLANLQTRVATLPDMPDRTLAQLKTVINNKVDGGTIDN